MQPALSFACLRGSISRGTVAMKRLILILAAVVVRQAGAAECPDHCTEDRIAYFAGIECYGPNAIDHQACNQMVWLLMRQLAARNIDCEHPSVWVDNQSTLTRVDCVAGEPPPTKLTATAYGLGLGTSPDGVRVVSFAKITSDDMWTKWLASARIMPATR